MGAGNVAQAFLVESSLQHPNQEDWGMVGGFVALVCFSFFFLLDIFQMLSPSQSPLLKPPIPSPIPLLL